jgi:type II secretion system (T2SS) protein E
MDYATTQLNANEVIETPEHLAAVVQRMVATRVQQIALVTIAISFATEEGAGILQPVYNNWHECTRCLLQSLRALVRKTDIVCLYNSTLYFFLKGADMQGAKIVQNRLWEALLWRIHNISEGEVARPRSIASGFSAYPTPSPAVGHLLEAANDGGLRSNFGSEKPVRKAIACTAQRLIADEDLPALARKLGIPYLSLLPRKLPVRIQQLVNPQLAHELRCYPVGRERNMLTVAMLDPQDRLALERLRQETGLDIFPVLTHPLVLQMALDHLS